MRFSREEPCPLDSRERVQSQCTPAPGHGKCPTACPAVLRSQVQGRDFTWTQDLPTGWVGQRRREEWSGESSEEENRKHVHSPPLLPVRREDPGTHSHPPQHGGGCSFGDTWTAFALPQGLRSGQAQPHPLQGLAEPQDPGLQRRCGNEPQSCLPWEASPVKEGKITQDFFGKQLEAAQVLQDPQDVGPGFAIPRGSVICGQLHLPPA